MPQTSSTWPSDTQSYALSVLNPTTTPSHDKFPSDDFYLHAAEISQVELATIKAFAAVEGGPWGAFLPSGEPTILFERHLFHRLTNGKFNGKRIIDVSISNVANVISSPVPGGYGSPYIQHKKLAFAVGLDRDAALQSTSWGLFQILGLNHERAGFTLLQSFINAMYRSADDQLLAFVAFIKSDTKLHNALQTKDWLTAARRYNGAKQNGYDVKIKTEYERLSSNTK